MDPDELINFLNELSEEEINNQIYFDENGEPTDKFLEALKSDFSNLPKDSKASSRKSRNDFKDLQTKGKIPTSNNRIVSNQVALNVNQPRKEQTNEDLFSDYMMDDLIGQMEDEFVGETSTDYRLSNDSPNGVKYGMEYATEKDKREESIDEEFPSGSEETFGSGHNSENEDDHAYPRSNSLSHRSYAGSLKDGSKITKKGPKKPKPKPKTRLRNLRRRSTSFGQELEGSKSEKESVQAKNSKQRDQRITGGKGRRSLSTQRSHYRKLADSEILYPRVSKILQDRSASSKLSISKPTTAPSSHPSLGTLAIDPISSVNHPLESEFAAEVKLKELHLRLQGHLGTIRSLESQLQESKRIIDARNKLVAHLKAKVKALTSIIETSPEGTSLYGAPASSYKSFQDENKLYLRAEENAVKYKTQADLYHSKTLEEQSRRQKAEERSKGLKEYADKLKNRNVQLEKELEELKAFQSTSQSRIHQFRKSYRESATEAAATKRILEEKDVEIQAYRAMVQKLETQLRNVTLDLEFTQKEVANAKRESQEAKGRSKDLQLQLSVLNEKELTRQAESRLNARARKGSNPTSYGNDDWYLQPPEYLQRTHINNVTSSRSSRPVRSRPRQHSHEVDLDMEESQREWHRTHDRYTDQLAHFETKLDKEIYRQTADLDAEPRVSSDSKPPMKKPNYIMPASSSASAMNWKRLSASAKSPTQHELNDEPSRHEVNTSENPTPSQGNSSSKPQGIAGFIQQKLAQLEKAERPPQRDDEEEKYGVPEVGTDNDGNPGQSSTSALALNLAKKPRSPPSTPEKDLARVNSSTKNKLSRLQQLYEKVSSKTASPIN